MFTTPYSRLRTTRNLRRALFAYTRSMSLKKTNRKKLQALVEQPVFRLTEITWSNRLTSLRLRCLRTLKNQNRCAAVS